MLDQPIDLCCIGGYLRRMVALFVLIESSKQPHNLLLANFHGAANTLVLLLNIADDFTTTRHKARSCSLQSLGPAVGNDVCAQGNVLSEVLFGGAVHHEREAVSMGDISHFLDADHALLNTVMAFHVEKRDCLLVDGFFNILWMDLVCLSNLDGNASTQANHRIHWCAVINGVTLLENDLVGKTCRVGQAHHIGVATLGHESSDGQGYCRRRARSWATGLCARVLGDDLSCTSHEVFDDDVGLPSLASCLGNSVAKGRYTKNRHAPRCVDCSF